MIYLTQTQTATAQDLPGAARSVSIVMLPGRRRSERNKAAREKAMKESEEGAARDSDAEDAYEDSDGPGPDPGRAQWCWLVA